METKHTPTPWGIVDCTNKGKGFTIQSPLAHYSNCNVASYVGLNDASFIVRACNAHDELVSALMDIHPTIANDSYRAEIGALIAKARGEA